MTEEETRIWLLAMERAKRRRLNREWTAWQRSFAPRIQEAKRLLGRFARYVKITGYTCDPDSCGHSESIILRWNGFYGVCYSLDQLRKKIPRLYGRPKRQVREILLGAPRWGKTE